MSDSPELKHITLTTENDVPVMQIREDTPLNDTAIAPEIAADLEAIREYCGNQKHYVLSFFGHEDMPSIVYTQFVKFWGWIRIHDGSVAICNMSREIRKMFMNNFSGTMATIRFYGPLGEAIGEQLERTRRTAPEA